MVKAINSSDSSENSWIQLRRLMADTYNLQELRELCFDLAVDPDEVWGQGVVKSDCIRGLILYLRRQERLAELLDNLQGQRPHIEWPAQFPDFSSYEHESLEEAGLVRAIGDFINTFVPISRLDANRARRMRQVIIQKVSAYWIEGTLKSTLYDVLRLELRFSYKTNAVERPWAMTLNHAKQEACDLPAGTDLSDVFQNLAGSMLILGEPGSGKTITLLELARALLEEAKEDETKPIPVIFNLSSWAYKRQRLDQWLVEELNLIYQVNPKYGQKWLQLEPFRLLLDGLDEVREEHREACIQAINRFRLSYGLTDMVVCSRTADYERLSNRLRLSGAIIIQPLTQEKIDRYLAAGGERLAAARVAVSTDAFLRELAQTPLNLSIIALAYRDKPVADLAVGTLNERRFQLFDVYVQQMFIRRPSTKYTEQQERNWLNWLAFRMMQHSITVFHIERLQPSWLPANKYRRVYGFSLGFIVGTLIWLSIRLAFGTSNNLTQGIIAGIGFGLCLGIYTGLGGASGIYKSEMRVGEAIGWSWNKAVPRLIIGLVIGGFFIGIPGALFGSLILGLLVGGLEYQEIDIKTKPNLGISRTARNAIRIGIGTVIIITAILGLFTGISAVRYGALVGLTLGLIFGGEVVLRHYILRFFFSYNGNLPWKVSAFLDEASEQIILRKVGGGYIFVHRMLLEHLGSLRLDKTR